VGTDDHDGLQWGSNGTLALTALIHAAAFAQGVTSTGLVVREEPFSAAAVASVMSSEPLANRWAKPIASAAHRSLIQSGVETAKEALIECQRGDYPGGGMGLRSMPIGRPESRTDHCFR
jgi:hypothetical protein